MKWVWALVGVGVIGAIYAFFKSHQKIGSLLLIGAVAGGSISLFASQKTDRMNAMTKSEYDAVMFYNALYEATGEDLYKNISKEEAWHYNYLTGYGYSALGESVNYPLTLEGAIKSEQDAIKGYEEALSYAVGDSALKSDLQRIIQDEKEHLNKLIEFSTEEQEGFNLNLEKITQRFNLRELEDGLRVLVSRIREQISERGLRI